MSSTNGEHGQKVDLTLDEQFSQELSDFDFEFDPNSFDNFLEALPDNFSDPLAGIDDPNLTPEQFWEMVHGSNMEQHNNNGMGQGQPVDQTQ